MMELKVHSNIVPSNKFAYFKKTHQIINFNAAKHV
jgi:hypothetical protein